MTKIKICGLQRAEDITYVNQCMPDYIGFVFAKSRRQITREQAAVLRKLLRPEITAVGVFVNEEAEVVAELLKEGIIDVAQLHGEESETYIKRLKELTAGAPLIKAVRVAGMEDVRRSADTGADYLLFDSFSVRAHGGTGKCFDWSLIGEVTKPFFLAGGIGAENVAEAIGRVHPYAVDVSSAVETDGWKDAEKIQRMIARVRENC